MEIRLLYLEGCPNAEPAYQQLKECLDQENVNESIVRTQISDEAEAARFHFLGSPSIQIDGEDIESLRQGDSAFFGCRIYDAASNQPGVPSREMMIAAIHHARTHSQ